MWDDRNRSLHDAIAQEERKPLRDFIDMVRHHFHRGLDGLDKATHGNLFSGHESQITLSSTTRMTQWLDAAVTAQKSLERRLSASSTLENERALLRNWIDRRVISSKRISRSRKK